MNNQSINLETMTITSAGKLIQDQKISIEHLTQAILDQVHATEPKINAFITVLVNEAMQNAQILDKEIAAGKYRGPLHGIPVGLKDIIDMKGVLTSNGSQFSHDTLAEKDATVTSKLAENGAIIVGKLNLHEFAFGTSSVNPHYGAVKNPWNTKHVSGGSSGGSAAAIAANSCLGTIGTDTGGSIRIPASLCGVTGFMPTSGRVSKHLITPLAWSLDHAGPIAKTVEDCCIILDHISGYDKNDQYSFNLPPTNTTEHLTGDIQGLNIGLPKLLWNEADATTIQYAQQSVELLEKLGANVQEIDLPLLEEVREIEKGRFRILLAEAATYHSKRIREHPEMFGKDVLASLQLGSLVSATSYLNAQRIREKLISETKEQFNQVDVFISPTTIYTAPLISEGDVQAKLSRLTAPYDILDLPSISICCGFDDNNLPIGLMFAAKQLNENVVANVAHTFEQNIQLSKPNKDL